MKKNNKGFTLVELIVVLVILAILAAILVPALLGYIDKAREKRVTTNAEAAFVAAQAILTEQYGKGATSADAQAKVTMAEIQKLTDITQTFDVKFECGTTADTKHAGYVITKFSYIDEDNNIAHWNPTNGQWAVDKTNSLYDGTEDIFD